jgi:hypothetical protein
MGLSSGPMNSPPDSAPMSTTKAQGRSRVSNGATVFLDEVDGRSVLARRYRDVVNQLVAHMGNDPSAAQAIIIKRASSIVVWCERAEAAMANGEDLDIAEFTTATNALRRLLTDLGLERRAKDITTLGQILGEAHRG